MMRTKKIVMTILDIYIIRIIITCYNEIGGFMNDKITIKNFFRHLHTVNKHRWKVFCLCCRVGIPLQGLLHDLSKYSFEEFFESVKYYQGTRSPIKRCKEVNGYSRAWLHHKGRNKHHYEYWYDYNAPLETPMMPFKYYLEMICDTMAAGQTYQGKNWSKEYQLSYWNNVRDKAKLNPNMLKLLDKTYLEISKKGLNAVLKKKYLRKLYEKYSKEDKSWKKDIKK